MSNELDGLWGPCVSVKRSILVIESQTEYSRRDQRKTCDDLPTELDAINVRICGVEGCDEREREGWGEDDRCIPLGEDPGRVEL